MARHSRITRSRRKSSVVPAVVASAALFAVVTGYLLYAAGGFRSDGTAARRPASKPQQADLAATRTAPLQAESPATAEPTRVPASTESSSQDAADLAPAAPRQVALSASDLVEAQLAAGEFGPALQTAGSVEDPDERAHLLQVIAEKQLEAGEFDAAASVLRRLAHNRRRLGSRPAEARPEQPQSDSLAGGGSGADFQPLIDLLMQETSGPWFELDGVGGTISEFETGVRVDPGGLLHRVSREELTGRLKELGIRARVADLNEDMARAVPLRLVSLTRLEREIARRLSDGEPVVATMKNLAGLTAVSPAWYDQGTISLALPVVEC